jgi:hypothetical protein
VAVSRGEIRTWRDLAHGAVSGLTNTSGSRGSETPHEAKRGRSEGEWRDRTPHYPPTHPARASQAEAELHYEEMGKSRRRMHENAPSHLYTSTPQPSTPSPAQELFPADIAICM